MDDSGTIISWNRSFQETGELLHSIDVKAITMSAIFFLDLPEDSHKKREKGRTGPRNMVGLC